MTIIAETREENDIKKKTYVGMGESEKTATQKNCVVILLYGRHLLENNENPMEAEVLFRNETFVLMSPWPQGLLYTYFIRDRATFSLYF